MADIGSLIVNISADASGFITAMERMGGSAQQFGRGMATMGKILATTFLASATAAVAMTVQAGKQAEELAHLSTITGINTDTLQEYDVLLTRAGLDATDLTVVMRTLSKNMEDARTGTGNAADRFRQLGIDIQKVTSTDDLIRKIADSLSKFANGTQKAAIESDLLGRGGLRLALAMEGGSKAMDEAARASQTLGAALSAGQLAELATMDDRIDDLTLAWKRFGQQIGSFVAPAIKFAADALSSLLNMASQGLKSMNALGGVGVTPDTRTQPPALIDTAKIAARQQALLDAQLKSKETFSQDSLALAKSASDRQMVIYDQEKAFGIKTDQEFALARQQQIARMDAFTVESLQKQLRDYVEFAVKKRHTFTEDEKGLADKLKFEEEVHGKELSMMTQIVIAQQDATTHQIQAGLQVKTFWQRQLGDLVASNAFSVSQIVSTWTSGIANAIVNGGNFVQAAWKSTQVAIIQGGLNTLVVWAGQQAQMAAASTATASLTTAVWAGATTAISGFFATITTAFTAMIANMVAIVTAVGEFIMGVLSAIATALTETIFGIPWAGAIFVGIALIAAALAATGNLGFKEGGIGDFGSATPAMLHGPEAIIPLNQKGAAFLREAFGMGEKAGQIIHTHVYLDRRQIALAVSDSTPSALRTMGVL